MDWIDFFGREYLSKLDDKKRRELFAVYHFLLNEKYGSLDKNKFKIDSPEPSDIIYEDKKFQVTTGSGDSDAVVNMLDKKITVQKGNTQGGWWKLEDGTRVKTYGSTLNLEEALEQCILNPIRNKISKYGKNNISVQDVSLTIFSYNLPITSHEDSYWQSFLNKNKDFFESSGFKEIYWSDHKRNIPIYIKNNTKGTN